MAGGLASQPLRASVRSTPPARLGPNDEIHTAILGIRAQGRHHIAYHQATRNIRIVALCDIDQSLFADRVTLVQGPPPDTQTDFRRILDNKDVHCVSIATPNHWHALMTVLACQAGKDVYVEKPATWCIAEGRKMIAAARRYNRIVQVGTNSRASTGRQKAMKLLRAGVIGEIYMARGFHHGIREPIGIREDAPVPEGVNYDLWLGPAPQSPFNPNRFHYVWHWNWTYGNGEIGNNGPHYADAIVEGLGKQGTHPVRVSSHGRRFVWKDQGQTPNVQTATYEYDDGTLATLEISNLPADDQAGMRQGVVFYGSKGYMALALKGDYRTVVDGEDGPRGSGSGAHPEHVANFYQVMRSRRLEDLLAPPEYGHAGATLCHLGNIAYRFGRTLQFDPKTETFEKDAAANAMLTREYRPPFVMPDEV
jgi:predicted dehydrogenase